MRIALCKALYINKILVYFAMQNSKKGCTPFQKGITLSKDQYSKMPEEEAHMRRVLYASMVGSLMYVMLCTRPDICYTMGIVSRYHSNPDLNIGISSSIYLSI